jgi:GT2 family glycosyltransferase
MITVIILNWNGLEDTIKCINSLLRINLIRFNIVVIDNGSVGDDVVILKKQFGEKIHIHSLGKNLGFTGGVNYGIKEAIRLNSDYFLLLNNDTEVDPDFLKYMLHTAKIKSNIGIVGSFVYDYSKRKVIRYSGSGVNWFLAKPYHKTDFHLGYRNEIYVTGCAMLIKKEVIDDIGLLDNIFFAYFEDTAFCLLAKKAGYISVSEPKAKVYHKEAASTGKKNPMNTYLVSRNRILFVNKYLPKLYRVYFLFFNFLKLIFVSIYLVVTNQRLRAYAFAKGYWDGTLGRGGEPRI